MGTMPRLRPLNVPSQRNTRSSTSAVGSGIAPKEIHIELCRRSGEERIGIALAWNSRSNEGIRVLSVDPAGLAMRQWNENNKANELCAGDFIVSVNDARTYTSMFREMQKVGTLRICARRNVSENLQAGDDTDLIETAGMDTLVTQNLIDGLKRVDLSGSTEGTDCCICLDCLDGEQHAVQLPCGHTFHHRCAEQWFMQCLFVKSALCPLCKQQAIEVPPKRMSL